MLARRRPTALLLTLSAFALLACTARGADWPAFGHDARRSGATDEQLVLPLRPAWVHAAAQPPRPAWPEPGRELHRNDFDYAFQPVAAAGLVFYGSSADDTVRALDLATGAVRWRFTTGGPVRFAPQISQDRCLFASDDGFAYCVRAQSGRLIWKHRLAPEDRRLAGNSRVISRWPCRAGVLAAGGVVYVTAGMWPSEGVFVHALDERTGRVLWRNETSGSMYLLYPHGGAYSIGGVAPQGYMAAEDDVLLVPTGRAVPAGYDRAAGRLLHYRIGESRSAGGWRLSVAGDCFFNPANAGGADEPVRLGEAAPRPGDGTDICSVATGQALDTLRDHYCVLPAGGTLYAARPGAVEALGYGHVKWTAQHARVYCMALVKNALLVGGAGTLTALSPADGSVAWTAQVEGQVRGLAVADGRVLAATERGAIHCFAPAAQADQQAPAPAPRQDAPAAPPSAEAAELARLAGPAKGFALVLGMPDERLAVELARATRLHVVNVTAREEEADRQRAAILDSTNLYGTRVAVAHVEDLKRLPFADYMANLIVVGPGAADGASPEELFRVLRPCGGVMALQGAAARLADRMPQSSPAGPAQVRRGDGFTLVVRGKLPGAFDWDSREQADERVRWPLELLWFGGPGPARMVGRHWGAPTPVPAGGRYFVVGEQELIAVDAYNGCELWSRRFDGLFWKAGHVSADDARVYVHFGARCVELDAATGEVMKTYEAGELAQLPPHAARPPRMPPDPEAGGRSEPLTGRVADKTYRRGHGCGGSVSSATMDFFRSGTLGFYDLLDDSGVRNFSAARPGCGITMIPALGLLISSEGSASCSCSYNFQTSLALAPAARRSNEDWAVFGGPPPSGTTRYAALNLGAPGDRRDERGLLWLGIPRPGIGLQFRCELEFDQDLSPYRVNADAAAIEGANRPWVYASGLRGLRRLELGLEQFRSPASVQCARAPAIDGLLDDPCWQGGQDAIAPADDGGAVMLRHDDGNLYVGYRRPAAVDRLGHVTPWKRQTAGEDAAVWKDDSCEIVLGDTEGARSVHLGVSASGARYDGLCSDPDPVYDVPRLEGITVDGRVEDWGARGFIVRSMPGEEGKMLPAKDFDPSFRIGWDERGLLLLAEVRDDRVIEYFSRSALWVKDSLEIFLSAGRGSDQRFQLSVAPGADERYPAARTWFLDERPSRSSPPLTAEAAGRRTEDGYLVEVRVPWSDLGAAPAPGREIALQMMINDADTDGPYGGDWFRAFWHPGGHTGFNRMACHRIRLAQEPGGAAVFTRGAEPDARGMYTAEPPDQYPVLNVPRLAGIAIDGDAADWGERGFRQDSLAGEDGRMRPAENFDPSFRMGWCDEGLLLLARVRDDVVIEDPDPARLWRKDSVEVFVAPRRGAAQSWQVAMGTGVDPQQPALRTQFFDNRGAGAHPALEARVAGKRAADGYVLEALLPWRNLSLTPLAGGEIGVQVFFNDADAPGRAPGDWFRATWHPLGHAIFNRMAFHRVRLSEEPGPPVRFERGREVDAEGLVRARAPYPWPMPKAQAGGAGEDSSWNGRWLSAARADDAAFTAEMAVPWKTLEAAGLDRARLTVDVRSRGPLSRPPLRGLDLLDFRPAAAAAPRPHTVRLYWAELDDVRPGERVFDVKLQGRTVIEGMDVAREAGGVRRALMREFRGIMASDRLVLELVPGTQQPGDRTAPVLNAIEVTLE